METKIAFGLLAIASILAGCAPPLPVVYPEDISDTTWLIDAEQIQKIRIGQYLPARVKTIKGKTIEIDFRNEVCSCSKKRKLTVSVLEVGIPGLKGMEVSSGVDVGGVRRAFYDLPNEGDYDTQCKSFVVAEESIGEAVKLSDNRYSYYTDESGGYFFLDSYKLIWEAERAIGPLECDPVRSKILSDKAKDLALGEGARSLGFDISGTYEASIVGIDDHPAIAMLFEKSEDSGPVFVIEQIDSRITGSDGSGTAVLEGTRMRDPSSSFSNREIVRFRFFFPESPANQITGEWKIEADGLNFVGTWNEYGSDISHKWDMLRTDLRQEALPIKRKEKYTQKFLAQKAPVHIDWKAIEEIRVWTKDIDWEFCVVGFTTCR